MNKIEFAPWNSFVDNVLEIPEPAIVIETPVEQPPSYGGGGGGGGGQFDTQSLSENNPWDSYGRQLGGDRSRNMEFQ